MPALIRATYEQDHTTVNLDEMTLAPGVSITVEFLHGAHAKALDDLERAYEDVRRQIEAVGYSNPKHVPTGTEDPVNPEKPEGEAPNRCTECGEEIMYGSRCRPCGIAEREAGQ